MNFVDVIIDPDIDLLKCMNCTMCIDVEVHKKNKISTRSYNWLASLNRMVDSRVSPCEMLHAVPRGENKIRMKFANVWRTEARS
jgi:polyferredoxin